MPLKKVDDAICNPLGIFIDTLGTKRPVASVPQQTNKQERKIVPSENAELAWMKDVDHKGNSYLVLVNHSGRTLKEDDQIMFYYGKYTNAYLLLNYGFCYRDNKYDQVDISLEMRPSSQNPADIV